jgi:hypothetical protein
LLLPIKNIIDPFLGFIVYRKKRKESNYGENSDN